MKYELPFKRTGYLPSTVEVLSSLDKSEINYEDLSLHHPLDIFYFTFSDVVKCLNRLIDRYERDILNRKSNVQYNVENIEEYSFDIFNVIFYSSNFIEACQSIVRIVCGGNQKKQTKAVREFNDATQDYRSHISKIINEIKHKHRRVNAFSYSWESNLIVGYYIEGVARSKGFGPDPLIHKVHNGLLTGFSLNRYIPYYLINLYYVSSCLSSVLSGHAKTIDIDTTPIKIDTPDIVSCLQKVSKLPMTIFSNELELTVPSILQKDNSKFSLEFPGKRKIENKMMHIASISLGARVGLHCKQLEPPYFQG